MSALLEVKHLETSFATRGSLIKAVDGVSFSLEKGQTMGIVGESGSGKSVTCYSLLDLIPRPPGQIDGGSALFKGRDLLQMSESELRSIRGREISFIFQDPMTSLNPFMKVSSQLTEPLRIHRGFSRKEALTLAIEELEAVGIRDASKRVHSYPHEFSGGMRQRVMIAMALITRPEILIADEPTTALDVTVQQQVLNLIKKRQQELGTAVIFVTHDLAVVSEICDYVNVMYAGRFVERAPVRQLFSDPRHPYTMALQRSIPALQERGEDLHTIPGLPPDLSVPIKGCAFAPRCDKRCPDLALSAERPPLTEVASEHWAQLCPCCVAPGDPDHI